LIRHVFHVDPWALSDEEFIELLSEAQYIKLLDARIMQNSVLKALAIAFGNEKGNGSN